MVIRPLSLDVLGVHTSGRPLFRRSMQQSVRTAVRPSDHPTIRPSDRLFVRSSLRLSGRPSVRWAIENKKKEAFQFIWKRVTRCEPPDGLKCSKLGFPIDRKLLTSKCDTIGFPRFCQILDQLLWLARRRVPGRTCATLAYTNLVLTWPRAGRCQSG